MGEHSTSNRLERAYRFSDWVFAKAIPGVVGGPLVGSGLAPASTVVFSLPLSPEMISRRLYFWGLNSDAGLGQTAGPSGVVEFTRNGQIVFELPVATLNASDVKLGVYTSAHNLGVVGLVSQTVNLSGTDRLEAASSNSLCYYIDSPAGGGVTKAAYCGGFQLKTVADSVRLRVTECAVNCACALGVYSER